jgi:predicted DNA-binding protein (UPF0251 family)
MASLTPDPKPFFDAFDKYGRLLTHSQLPPDVSTPAQEYNGAFVIEFEKQTYTPATWKKRQEAAQALPHARKQVMDEGEALLSKIVPLQGRTAVAALLDGIGNGYPLAKLWALRCEHRSTVIAACSGPAVSGGKTKGRGRKRRNLQVRPLTRKQAEAVYVMGDCNGNFTAAAKRLGVNRKTVWQNYWAAMKKIGTKVCGSPEKIARAQRALEAVGRTMQLPSDRRGQTTVSVDSRRS